MKARQGCACGRRKGSGPGGAGSPGAQRQGADFLTLPEAIRAAAPHGEFKAAEGESRGGNERLSPLRGRGAGGPSCGRFALCHPDPACPNARTTDSRY